MSEPRHDDEEPTTLGMLSAGLKWLRDTLERRQSNGGGRFASRRREAPQTIDTTAEVVEEGKEK